MPRKARIDAPGALHHVIVRGIEQRAIFRDENDTENFIERLGTILTETATPCFAWALMGNHVHLLLRTGLAPVAAVMQRLLTGYAQRFNRRHGRRGRLFQNRYRSILCEEDVYLLELVRYIHLNPLRAGIVESLDQLACFTDSGHATLMGTAAHPWQDTAHVLNCFGNKVTAARKAYLAYVEKGISRGKRTDLTGGGLVRSAGGWRMLKALRRGNRRVKGDERILGSGAFVAAVLKKAGEDYELRTRLQATGPDLDTLIDMVCRHLEIAPETVRNNSKYRDVSRARALVCYLATRKLMLSNVAVAGALGISASTVSRAAARGQKDGQLETIQQELLGEMGLERH